MFFFNCQILIFICVLDFVKFVRYFSSYLHFFCFIMIVIFVYSLSKIKDEVCEHPKGVRTEYNQPIINIDANCKTSPLPFVEFKL